MTFRNILSSRKRRLTALLSGIVLAVVCLIAIGASGASTSFFAECLRPFHEGQGGEKALLQERECRLLATLKERHLTSAQRKAAKAEFRATHKPYAESPEPARITGISVGPAAPDGLNQVFHSRATWTGEVDSQWYIVYAGAKASPDTNENVRSEVLVFRAPPTFRTGESNALVGAYNPPGDEREPLTIAAATGDVLTLRTTAGTLLSFDVATRSFGQAND